MHRGDHLLVNIEIQIYKSKIYFYCIEESKSASPFEINQNVKTNKIDIISSQSVIDATMSNVDKHTNTFHYSLDMAAPYDDISTLFQSTNGDRNRSNRKYLSRFQDQIARTTINDSPSLSSALTTNASLKSNVTEIVYWLDVHIERGKDLSIKDLNGTSDPYVKVYYGTEERHVTNIIYKSLNPLWNENVPIFVHDLNIPLYFYVFDYDRIGRDESMGFTKLDLWKLPLEQVYHATLDLENEKRNDGKTGMLKISITITPKTSEFRDEVR